MQPALGVTAAESAACKLISEGKDVDFSGCSTTDRTLRSNIVAEACLARSASLAAVPIRIKGAIVAGKLDFTSRTISAALHWSETDFDSPLEMADAKLQGIRFSDCRLAGIKAKSAEFSSSLVLEAGTSCDGQVVLADSKIHGDLSLDDSTFQAKEPVTIDASRLKCDGSISFLARTVIHGKAEFTDSIVKGHLRFEACHLKNPFRESWVGNRMQVGANVVFKGGMVSEGILRLHQAQISGSLEFDDSRFEFDYGVALQLNAIQVRGAVQIRWGFSSTGEVALRYASAVALEIGGARFSNPNGVALSLNRTTISGALTFNQNTRFEGEVSLWELKIGQGLVMEGVQFSNPTAVAIRGDGLSAGGSMIVRGKTSIRGVLRFVSAKIGTFVSIQDTSMINFGGICFDAYGLTTGGTISFRTGFSSAGEVRLTGAQIGTDLVIENAKADHFGQVALRLDSVNVKGSIACHNTTVEGFLRLVNARADGTLDFDGCSLSNIGGICVEAYEGKFGNVSIVNNATMSGTVAMINARIAGGLTIRNADFQAPGRFALNLEGANIGQSVLLNNSNVEGEIRLSDARLAGVFDCRSTALKNRGGACVNATRIQVTGRVYLDLPASSSGEVVFTGAKIGNDWEISGGTTEEYGSIGLNLSSMQCAGTVTLRDLFCAWIRLSRSRIDGDLDCRRISLMGADKVQFLATNATVKGTFTWQRIRSLFGEFNVTGCKVGQLNDEEASWPGPGRLYVSNFEYALHEDAPADKRRIEWLRLQARFNRQPYEQAIKALRQNGRTREARNIALALRRDERRSPDIGASTRFWNGFLDVTIGHGHQVWRALFWAAGVVAIGAILFYFARVQFGIVAPIEPTKYSLDSFNYTLYSLDLFLPVVDLFQEKNFRIIPQTPAQYLYLAWIPFEILSGWILTTVFVAGVSGLVKKD